MENTFPNGQNIAYQLKIILEDFKDIVLNYYKIFLVLGKVEGDKNNDDKKNWHGHISAITVAPEYRR